MALSRHLKDIQQLALQDLNPKIKTLAQQLKIRQEVGSQ